MRRTVMLRSHRLALASAAVIIGLTLAACGDAPESTIGAGTPPVVHVGSGGKATGDGGAETAADADGARLAMPYGYITYLFDGQLPVLDSTGTGWMFPAGATPDLDRLARMAAALGVEGDVHAVPADQGGGWMAGPADYSGASLWVGSDGMLSWWYNPAPSDIVKGGGSAGCAYVDPAVEDVAPDQDTTGVAETPAAPGDTIVVDPMPCEEYVEPEPPVGVPNEAESIDLAKALFDELGYDTGDYDFEAYADEWGSSVTAYLLIDGARAPISLSAGFGENGAVTWAGGVLADPVAVGDYPLVDAATGLERLNDETGQWIYYGMGYLMDGAAGTVARDTAVAESGSASNSGGGSDSVEGVTEPAVDMPMPCDTTTGCEMPEPEPIEIHFSTVRLGMTTIYDVDGTVWLLPAFVFGNANGEEYTVIAVDGAYLDMPETVVPTPDTVPVDTTPPSDTTPGEVPPPDTLPAEVDVDAASELLVGLTVDEATKIAEENGWELRVSRVDGEDQIVTADYRPLRLNVAVEGGVVTEVLSAG